ncbi:MAG: hypothetical protein H6737_23095 [Alphaproteobacteria bacterium]|nr:hypothetical protein [Alphaproteobacteria bacterium]
MVVLALAGCASIHGIQTGRTLDKGQFTATSGVEVGYVTARPLRTGMTRYDLGLRYGLTDDWEVGARVGGWAFVIGWAQVGADVKRRLVRAPSDREGWDVSVAVAASWDGVWGGWATGQAVTGQVPLLVSKNLPNRSELVFAPRVAVQHIRSRGAHPITKPLIGASFGWALHPGRFTLYPTVGVLLSNNPADPVSQLVTWQGGFGLGYDFGPGTSPKKRAER